MVEIKFVDRKTPFLSPSSLQCLSQVPTVNLTAGCAHECLYCYIKGYSGYPGEERITLYKNTAAKLREEILRKRKKPTMVYFSPSSDLFQPTRAVLDIAHEVISDLLEMGIGVSFLTKGKIPSRTLELLAANSRLVHAQVGLTTMNPEISRLFEPKTPLPRRRLAQVGKLVQTGITTQVRLDPILPGITDTSLEFDVLCTEVARQGVTQMAAGVLFLRPAIVHSLRKYIADPKLIEILQAGFKTGRRIQISAKNSSVTALPQEMRSDIFDRLTRIGREHGLIVRTCACKNPDLATEPCGIAGRPQGVSDDLGFQKLLIDL